MGCNALKIQKELIGEVLKEHFPGVSENSVLATKFVGPVLFKLARHHLSAVAKVNKLDNKLKDRLLDFGINEKSNQAQAGNGNKAANEKSTEIPSQIFDSLGNQLDLAVSLKNEKLNDTGKSKQAYQAETKQEDATILDKNADKTANNLYKWAKECAK